jgi:hypothetical protein
MKNFILIAIPVFFACLSAEAQSFVNLNFESATVTATGVQPYGTFVPVGSALPGWTAYIGTSEVTEVGYNSPANSTASITVLGPNWTSADTSEFGVGIIDGNYSVDLQTGANPIYPTPEQVGVSIEQNGMVPSMAQSIQFEAAETTPLTVTFNGNELAPVALWSGVSSDGVHYTLYGADISTWAGQTGELNFTAVESGDNYDVLDDISFSSVAVTPEPNVYGLMAVGGLLLGAHKWSWRR